MSDEGGYDEVVHGRIRDKEPVVIFSERVVQFPTLSGVHTAHRHLWGVHIVAFWGCHWGFGPEEFQLVVVIVIPSRRAG